MWRVDSYNRRPIMTWQLTVINFRRWKMCTCGFQQRRDVVAWLHCQTYKFCLISDLWSWWQNIYIGDIRTTCNDNVKRFLEQTSQLWNCQLMLQLWKQCQLACLHRRGRCWVLKAWWTQTHKFLIWLYRRVSAYMPDQAQSDVSPEGSIPAMCLYSSVIHGEIQ